MFCLHFTVELGPCLYWFRTVWRKMSPSCFHPSLATLNVDPCVTKYIEVFKYSGRYVTRGGTGFPIVRKCNSPLQSTHNIGIKCFVSMEHTRCRRGGGFVPNFLPLDMPRVVAATFTAQARQWVALNLYRLLHGSFNDAVSTEGLCVPAA
jgi:hypothetical protein